MLTKTIRLKQDEYTNLDTELDNHDLVILTGARGSGKSYPVAKKISSYLEQNEDAKFIYMRIMNGELATFAGWCSDLNLEKITGCPVNKLTRGQPTKGDIMIHGYTETGELEVQRVIGKCVSLESSHLFKSGKYDDFVAVVFEEYTHRVMGANHEKQYVFNFLENIQSIFRNRPLKVFCIGNSLKTIPLLDTSIDELTGIIFKNPLKIKIFRQGSNSTKNNFLAYLNGEQYDDDTFKVRIEEFRIIYTNERYIIWQHKIYDEKYYIQRNPNRKRITYRESEFLNLARFLVSSASNEYYFKTEALEREFSAGYQELIQEIQSFTAIHADVYLSAR